MSDCRQVRGCGTLILILAAAAPCLAGAVEIVSPGEGSLVFGRIEILLRVKQTDPAIDRIDIYAGKRLVATAYPPDWTAVVHFEEPLEGEFITAVGFSGDTIAGKDLVRSGKIGYLENVDVDLVQLYPVVLDRGGNYVRDLGREDFLVYENAKQVAMRHFSNEVGSLSIALLLDVSASMHYKLGRVQEASVLFAEGLGEDDFLALFSFNHALEQVVPLTLDHRRVLDEIWYLTPSGGTALYDALLGVIRQFDEVSGRKAIFIFSDGLDELSLTPLSRVSRIAAASEIIIYAVGTPERPGERAGARKDLLELATTTGGEAYFINDAGELADVFRRIREHLRAQYSIGYLPPPGEEEVRTIDVSTRQEHLRVRCRNSYHYKP